MVDFLKQLVDISLYPGRAQDEIHKIIKFATVGAIGIGVNMVCLSIFKEIFLMPLIVSSFVAIEISILTNFLMNDRWTFDGLKCEKSFLRILFSYNSICVGSMLINVITLVALTFVGINYLIGNALGILIGYIWNFLMNRRITWAENAPKF
jgi:dolichol-phosphate mannosyltransferase